MKDKTKNSAEEVKTSEENIKEVKLPKFKKKRYILLYLAILGFAVYAVITLVSQQVEISDKKQQLQNLQDQIVVQEIKNDDLAEVKNYSDEELSKYIEDKARNDMGYIKNGERVFVNVAGE